MQWSFPNLWKWPLGRSPPGQDARIYCMDTQIISTQLHFPQMESTSSQAHMTKWSVYGIVMCRLGLEALGQPKLALESQAKPKPWWQLEAAYGSGLKFPKPELWAWAAAWTLRWWYKLCHLLALRPAVESQIFKGQFQWVCVICSRLYNWCKIKRDESDHHCSHTQCHCQPPCSCLPMSEHIHWCEMDLEAQLHPC